MVVDLIHVVGPAARWRENPSKCNQPLVQLTHAIVWRGRASSDVRPSDSVETREKKINKATAKMFKNFPPVPR